MATARSKPLSNEVLRGALVVAPAAAVLALALFAFFQAQLSQIRNLTREDLSSISALKAGQVAAWRAERLGDGGVLADDPDLIAAVRQWRLDNSERIERSLLRRLRTAKSRYGYHDGLLVDSNGRIQMSLSGIRGTLDTREVETLARARHSHQPLLTDLQVTASYRFPHLAVIVPLGERTGGAILLIEDAHRKLFPLLLYRPLARASAESCLVRRESGRMTYLSPLRFPPGPGLTVQDAFPAGRAPDAWPVRDGAAWIDAPDYREVPVIGVQHAVADSPWYVVTKIDRAEALGPTRDRAVLVIVAVSTVVGGLMLAGVILWRKRTTMTWQAEKARHLSEERYARVVSAIDAGVWDWNLTTHECYIAPRWKAILGFAPDELPDEEASFFERLHPEDRDRAMEAIRAHFEDGTAYRAEFRLRRKAGDYCWVLARGEAMRDAAGQAVRMLGTITDISERRAAQEAMQTMNANLEQRVEQRTLELRAARAAAEAANHAKSAFLANMSHEIRTPMNAILGLTHLLRQEDPDPVRREKLGRIAKASQHLLQLISDILDLAKIEENKLVLEHAEVDLEALMWQVSALTGDKAHDKGIELLIDIDPALAAASPLAGDSGRLLQVLLNYVDNAIKFTDRGIIKVRACVEDDTPASQLLRFEVEDSGVGIDPKTLPRLFGAFEQADNSTTRRYGGTGLGLSINRRLARLMGGDVGVSSRLGEGSLFWFTVRLDKLPGPPRRPVRPAALRNRKALVIDDQDDARRYLAKVLRAWEVDVTEADSGAAALEVLAGSSAAFDLALIDWNMPGMDGIVTARRIAEMSLRRLPMRILLLTSFDDPEVRAEAAREGFAAVLTKPLTPSDLHDALCRLLAQALPPSAAESPAESEAAEVLAARHRGAHILLAEDDPTSQEVGRELLEAVGLSVTIAKDGAEAVSMLERGHYDLVLMDIQMPELDGVDATRAIRALPDGGKVPILAVTANVFVEDRQRCLAAGMNDFIAKPVDPQRFYSSILEWLGQGNARPTPGVRDDTPQVTRPAPRPIPESASSSTAAATIARLESLPGVDAVRGLALVRGDGQAYLDLLRDFVLSRSGGIEQLAASLDGNDAVMAQRLAHNLKGTAATLGVETLASRSARLESLLASGDLDSEAVRAEFAAIRRDMAEIGTALRSVEETIENDRPAH